MNKTDWTVEPTEKERAPINGRYVACYYCSPLGEWEFIQNIDKTTKEWIAQPVHSYDPVLIVGNACRHARALWANRFADKPFNVWENVT